MVVLLLSATKKGNAVVNKTSQYWYFTARTTPAIPNRMVTPESKYIIGIDFLVTCLTEMVIVSKNYGSYIVIRNKIHFNLFISVCQKLHNSLTICEKQ